MLKILAFAGAPPVAITATLAIVVCAAVASAAESATVPDYNSHVRRFSRNTASVATMRATRKANLCSSVMPRSWLAANTGP